MMIVKGGGVCKIWRLMTIGWVGVWWHPKSDDVIYGWSLNSFISPLYCISICLNCPHCDKNMKGELKHKTLIGILSTFWLDIDLLLTQGNQLILINIYTWLMGAKDLAGLHCICILFLLIRLRNKAEWIT